MRVWTVMAVAMVGGAMGCSAGAPSVAQAEAAVSGTLFADDFETAPTSWGMFEEIVGGLPDGGTSCYQSHIGEVAQTTEQHEHGSGSLRVFANALGQPFSNHVIAQRRIGTTGVDRGLRYVVWAHIDPQAGTNDGLHEGQTGPEISVQRTRSESGGWRTRTAGIQYVANHWSGLGTWQIWTDVGNGSAGWVSFRTMTTIASSDWVKLTLDFDYGTNRYVALAVKGTNINFNVSLANYAIVGEQKFSEDALWLTLESENVWSNCNGVYQYRVYYDDVSLATH